MLKQDSFLFSTHYVNFLLSNWGFKTGSRGNISAKNLKIINDHLLTNPGCAHQIKMLDNPMLDNDLTFSRKNNIITIDQMPDFKESNPLSDKEWLELVPKNNSSSVHYDIINPTLLKGVIAYINFESSGFKNNLVTRSSKLNGDAYIKSSLNDSVYSLGKLNMFYMSKLANRVLTSENEFSSADSNYELKLRMQKVVFASRTLNFKANIILSNGFEIMNAVNILCDYNSNKSIVYSHLDTDKY